MRWQMNPEQLAFEHLNWITNNDYLSNQNVITINLILSLIDSRAQMKKNQTHSH